MKYIILFNLLFIFSSLAYNQTHEAELENVKIRYETGDITSLEYKELAKDWKTILDDFGGYPDLPYNKERSIIQYEFIDTIPSLNKQTIFNRIIEWAAINFGSINAVLHYQNFESGKIILKGTVPIYQIVDIATLFSSKEKLVETTCYQTFIFTVKNHKIKTQVRNIGYEQIYYNYNAALSKNSIYKSDYSIHDLYPLTDFSSDTWKNKLSQLVSTDEKINELRERVVFYLSNYEQDYDF